jgi:hypothetical protein
MFNGQWSIAGDGTITANTKGYTSPDPAYPHWCCGDLGPQAAFVLESLVSYYAYSGDAAAIAQLDLQANMLLDYGQTDANNAWPNCIISIPVEGKPYGRGDPHGMIQLDFVAGMSACLGAVVWAPARSVGRVEPWADGGSV